MTNLTVYVNDANTKMYGDVVVTYNDEVVCALHDDKVDTFALNHLFEEKGRVHLYYNHNLPDGTTETRSFEVDPVKLTHALACLVRTAKTKNEDSFI